jgi:hypothetical protein
VGVSLLVGLCCVVLHSQKRVNRSGRGEWRRSIFTPKVKIGVAELTGRIFLTQCYIRSPLIWSVQSITFLFFMYFFFHNFSLNSGVQRKKNSLIISVILFFLLQQGHFFH